MKAKVTLNEKMEESLRDVEKFDKAMAKRPHVVVGVPAGSASYPDGTPVLLVALVHEFGSQVRNIPERSFLRAGIARRRKEYARFLGKITQAGLNGKDLIRQLHRLGLKAQTDVRQELTDLKTPPLKSRVGNPLVDTGHLRQSIIYEVRKGAD